MKDATTYTEDQTRRYAKAVKVNGCLRLHVNRYSVNDAFTLAEAIGEYLDRPMEVGDFENDGIFLVIRPKED